ncbi:50S ribosomal protein L22 [Candidatus Parcubacteria bacterium]|nr:MAG: 50S ribosomal protein L22 [Candidatus Parcubacteria bacterium]
MKAVLSNYHQSPRKVRLVANLIRGKSISAAHAALRFLPDKSGPVMNKLLDSAVANARQAGLTPEQLFVKTITVDKGLVMRRYRPFARGRAGSVRKTMSTVRLELGAVQASPKKTAKKAAKKKVAAKTETK